MTIPNWILISYSFNGHKITGKIKPYPLPGWSSVYYAELRKTQGQNSGHYLLVLYTFQIDPNELERVIKTSLRTKKPLVIYFPEQHKRQLSGVLFESANLALKKSNNLIDSPSVQEVKNTILKCAEPGKITETDIMNLTLYDLISANNEDDSTDLSLLHKDIDIDEDKIGQVLTTDEKNKTLDIEDIESLQYYPLRETQMADTRLEELWRTDLEARRVLLLQYILQQKKLDENFGDTQFEELTTILFDINGTFNKIRRIRATESSKYGRGKFAQDIESRIYNLIKSTFLPDKSAKINNSFLTMVLDLSKGINFSKEVQTTLSDMLTSEPKIENDSLIGGTTLLYDEASVYVVVMEHRPDNTQMWLPAHAKALAGDKKVAIIAAPTFPQSIMSYSVKVPSLNFYLLDAVSLLTLKATFPEPIAAYRLHFKDALEKLAPGLFDVTDLSTELQQATPK